MLYNPKAMQDDSFEPYNKSMLESIHDSYSMSEPDNTESILDRHPMTYY